MVQNNQSKTVGSLDPLNGNNGISVPEPLATPIDFKRPESMVGEYLDGRFLIEKNLTDVGADSGGIGVVYLAKDTKLMGKKVVVKVLSQAALKHDDIIRKFQHEKEALIRLAHPGIVRILDSGKLTDGNAFMVMEFVAGHSLRKALDRDRILPLDVAAHVIESVSDALTAAHAKQVLHRDIKPENIMLTPGDDGFDWVRLIDFGIARVGESELAPPTEIQRTIGTILYMAPEQIIGKPELTPAVDIYSTAIVAYEILTGRKPFKPRTAADMFQLEKDGVKTPPGLLRSDLPPDAERLILSALEFEVDKRPQNARAFGRELAAALRKGVLGADDDPIDLTISRRWPPTNDNGKHRRIWRWAVYAVLVLTALSIPAGYVLFYGTGASIGPDQARAESASGSQSNKHDTIPRSGVTAPAQDDEREISYFFVVQKMRNGKPFEAPFRTSGQEIFESGYRFRMLFQADADGFIYIFNEGKDVQGKTGFNLLFPTPGVNNGSAQVSKGQEIETAANTFTGGRGTEVNWLVWTKQKRDDLDEIARSATASLGSVSGETNAGLLRSLFSRYGAEPSANKDTVNQRMVVRSKGDIVVHRFDLEHR